MGLLEELYGFLSNFLMSLLGRQPKAPALSTESVFVTFMLAAFKASELLIRHWKSMWPFTRASSTPRSHQFILAAKQRFTGIIVESLGNRFLVLWGQRQSTTYLMKFWSRLHVLFYRTRRKLGRRSQSLTFSWWLKIYFLLLHATFKLIDDLHPIVWIYLALCDEIENNLVDFVNFGTKFIRLVVDTQLDIP